MARGDWSDRGTQQQYYIKTSKYKNIEENRDVRAAYDSITEYTIIKRWYRYTTRVHDDTTHDRGRGGGGGGV